MNSSTSSKTESQGEHGTPIQATERVGTSDAKHLAGNSYADERGLLIETFDRRKLRKHGIPTDFPYNIVSKSKQGVLRGVHVQRSPYQQAKIVTCLHGKLFDVIVDLRSGSEYFGAAYSTLLEPDGRSLYVPEGHGHAFVALQPNTTVHYQLSEYYAPEAEDGIHWESVDVSWPVQRPLVSKKDQQLRPLEEFKPIIDEQDVLVLPPRGQ